MRKSTLGRKPAPVQRQAFELHIGIQFQGDSPTRTDVKARSLAPGVPNDRASFEEGISQTTLKQDIKKFLDVLNDASLRQWHPSDHSPQPNDAIETFQKLGLELFENLFKEREGRNTRQKRKKLRDWLNSKNLKMIVVDCPYGTFPLEAVYYSEEVDPNDREHYIAMRAPIVHSPRESDSPFVVEQEPPTIGFLGHGALNSVSIKDDDSIHAVFQKIMGCTVHLETPLKSADRKTAMDRADTMALFRAFSDFRNVWHITSHTRPLGSRHCFMLDNGLSISAADLGRDRRPKGMLLGKPLVFLNFCDTGKPSQADDSSLCLAFLKLHAGGVIATRTVVYERFATYFAEHFYQKAFVGKTVARALHLARRESILHDETLAALTYFFQAEYDFALPVAANDSVAAGETLGARHVG